MKKTLWIDRPEQIGRTEWGVHCLQSEKHKLTDAMEPLPAILKRPAIDENSALFDRRHTLARPIQCLDLRRAEPILYPEELLASLHPALSITPNHVIYKVGDEKPVYIPAILLIQALFTGSRLLNEHLMRPMAPDLLGIATSDGDALYVDTARSVKSTHVNGRIARLVAWLLTAKDARHSHASVLANARDGKFALDLPKASLGWWVRGFEMEVGLLAFELNAVDLRFPIAQSTIILQAGSKVGRFPSYESPVRSPWSKGYVPGRRGAAVIVGRCMDMPNTDEYGLCRLAEEPL